MKGIKKVKLAYDEAWGERYQYHVGSWIFNTEAEAKQYIKRIQASQNLSKILKDQHEVKRRLKVKNDIQKLLRR